MSPPSVFCFAIASYASMSTHPSEDDVAEESGLYMTCQ